ncbi:DUF6894 family protein [Microvirga yunnanensis]|uniref:DUF6894 family protein n=1 Tax=Microvirga yunnanensis TaxID=2953740 RepID=UPI0021CAE170|nr:hypothetical protein [Microvirga sp. HBU65207]
MPHYFFDTYDDNLFVPDEVGQELEDIEAAKAVAQEELPQMAWDELPNGDQRTFIVSVRDEAGQVVIRAALSVVVEYPTQTPD